MKDKQEFVIDMLTTDQVMKILAVSAMTLRRWRKSGKIKAVQFPRKTYRYKKADIYKILQEGL